MKPRVTFIIAHHNYQQYLADAIQSALDQTYENIHVCVIDDCSNDPELALDVAQNIIGEFSDVVYEENKTTWRSDTLTFIQLMKEEGSYKQAFARNCGIKTCWDDSDYFAILDADDTNYPTKIARCVEEIDGDGKIAAAYTDTHIVQTWNNRLVREYREPFDYFRLMQECIIHSGCVIKKTALEAILENGEVFDVDLPPCEDYDLWVRLAEKFLFKHIPEPLVYVRVHPQNSTETSTHEHRVSRIQRIFTKKKLRNQ